MFKRWVKLNISHKKVVMWGASDQCRVNYPIVRELGGEVIALVDDTPNKKSPIKGVPIYCGEDGLNHFLANVSDENLGFIIAIGNPYGERRLELHDFLKSKMLSPAAFSDPSALICSSIEFGEGIQVMPGAVIHGNVRIGSQCIINTRSLVEHDCHLGNGVEVGPGAILCGRVTVGRNTWIGAGATIRPRVTIGENTIIGAGAVVVNDIPANVVAVGVPAKVIKEIKESK